MANPTHFAAWMVQYRCSSLRPRLIDPPSPFLPHPSFLSTVSLSAEERALYTRVHGDVYRRWKKFHAAGAAVVARYQITVSAPEIMSETSEL